MDRFEFQLAMLQKGAEELEKKIANFTTILMQLKTAVITIWVALIGWVFTSKIDALVPLGYVIILGFWFLEATYWKVQLYYIQRANAVTQFLNNESALDASFNARSIPAGLVHPLGSLKTIKMPALWTAICAPSIYIFYTFLFVVNSIVWLITLKTAL
ncbi:hypothetical protein [Microcoleus asticus]|uniref:Uncharacterized protein n=1 Tax=Microcoleus asticus IPMA8 TaxID=2563858 RepID=A0ABX2CVL1_9CYAN|nr:hypothetical protein [Microcoleus asticus]NQE34148.1 hypothetical protein [Microcoleus asticus IPMA8]